MREKILGAELSAKEANLVKPGKASVPQHRSIAAWPLASDQVGLGDAKCGPEVHDAGVFILSQDQQL